MNQEERETMRSALDAIEFYLNEIGLKEGNDPHYAPEDYSALETATKLRAALAQPEQVKPVACTKCNGLGYYDEGHENDDGTMSSGNYVECDKCHPEPA